MLLIILTYKRCSESSVNVTAIGAILMVYCAIIFLPLICLSSYHCGIVGSGETTKEEVKQVHAAGGNPDDLGCLQNWGHTCCVPIPDSKLVDLRALYQPRSAASGEESSDVEMNQLTAHSDEDQSLVGEAIEQPRGYTDRRDGYGVIMLTEDEEAELCGEPVQCDQDHQVERSPLQVVVTREDQGGLDPEVDSPIEENRDDAPLIASSGRTMDI